MNELDLIRKFQATLPAVRKWMDQTLAQYESDAVSVADLSFSRIGSVFPPDLIARAKVVVVTGKVPFPPLSRMGLPEFEEMENMPAAGITFKDTYFLHHRDQTESLHFHELVHVVQWERLGHWWNDANRYRRWLHLSQNISATVCCLYSYWNRRRPCHSSHNIKRKKAKRKIK